MTRFSERDPNEQRMPSTQGVELLASWRRRNPKPVRQQKVRWWPS